MPLFCPAPFLLTTAVTPFVFNGAVTRTSSSSGTPFSGSVTIPAGEFALNVFGARGNDALTNPTAAALDGNAATHIVSRATGSSGNMAYVSFWRVAAAFLAGSVVSSVTFDASDDNAPRVAAILLFSGVNASPIGATAGGSDGSGDSALVQSVTAQAASSYLVYAGAVGGNNPVNLTSYGGLTQIVSYRVGTSSTGYVTIFVGYKLAGSTSPQSIGCTASGTVLESVGQVVEVKAA